MAKRKRENWFKHDLDSRLVPGMQFYLQQTGLAGYGFFWLVIEEMYRRGTPELPRSEVELLSKTQQKEQKLAKGVLLDFAEIDAAISAGLWEAKGDFVYSKRVARELEQNGEKRKKISEIRRQAALKSVAARKQTPAKGSKKEQTAAKRLDERRNINIGKPAFGLSKSPKPSNGNGSKNEQIETLVPFDDKALSKVDLTRLFTDPDLADSDRTWMNKQLNKMRKHFEGQVRNDWSRKAEAWFRRARFEYGDEPNTV